MRRWERAVSQHELSLKSFKKTLWRRRRMRTYINWQTHSMSSCRSQKYRVCIMSAFAYRANYSQNNSPSWQSFLSMWSWLIFYCWYNSLRDLCNKAQDSKHGRSVLSAEYFCHYPNSSHMTHKVGSGLVTGGQCLAVSSSFHYFPRMRWNYYC